MSGLRAVVALQVDGQVFEVGDEVPVQGDRAREFLRHGLVEEWEPQPGKQPAKK